MRRFFDHSGQIVRPGHELGRGGEGAVFEIAGRPNEVAKVYLRQIPLRKQEKICAMAKFTAGHDDIRKFAAWPTATLHGAKGGELVGFAMARIAAKDIHQLYSPAQRKSLFPSADWRFLIHTARNCAVAFATLHSRGVVIGDVNQGNAQVSQNALVSLIDCDSFQFQENGRAHLCEVGVPHFTPPELQSAKFSRVIRTSNHDCFGLALLIFHLLFMGRHPFAGRYSGAGDMPIERAIKEYRFAYSAHPSTQMSPPPFSLPISVLPKNILNCFERAFGRGSEQPNSRPSAAEWVVVLDALEK